MPGYKWSLSFLKCNPTLKQRICQNLTTKLGSVDPAGIHSYLEHLGKELAGVDPKNIVNYDETNLSDDPGQKRCIFRQGVKYPERILNSTKSSTSVMFAGSASEEWLPLYVVYKAEHL